MMWCVWSGHRVQAGMIVIHFPSWVCSSCLSSLVSRLPLVSLSSPSCLPLVSLSSSLVVSLSLSLSLSLSRLVSSRRTWQALRLVMASECLKRVIKTNVCFSVHADGVHLSTVQANRGWGSRARVATQIAIESPLRKKMRKGA